MIAETIRRVEPLCPPENVWVLTRADLRERVRETVPEIAPERVIAEPEGRDTAPCLVLGAACVERVAPDARLLVLPADHVIPDIDAFCATVRGALEILENSGGLFTFGVEPDHPATGYGYIRRREVEPETSGRAACFPVDEFREKPDEATARRYLEEGGYYWNAGIFLWSTSEFRSALDAHAPELTEGWRALAALGPAIGDPTDTRFQEAFRTLPRISIDYALMEKASNVRVCEARFPWDDVGSWRAVERYRDADSHGNVTDGRTLLVESGANTVLAGERLVALLGVEGLLVVETPDAVLVCPRDRVEEVRKIVDGIGERGWKELL